MTGSPTWRWAALGFLAVAACGPGARYPLESGTYQCESDRTASAALVGSTLKIDLDGGQAILILSSAQALTLTLTEVPFEQWDQRSCKSTWAAGTHQQTFQIAPDPLRITSSAPDSGEAILETPRLVSGCLGEVVLKSAGTGVYGIFE